MPMRYLEDVVTLGFDSRRCNGCGACVEVCPHGVMQMDGDRVRVGDRDLCIECGACANNCATGAVSVQTGVGCAAAVINAALGRTSSACCCSVDVGGQEVPCC